MLKAPLFSIPEVFHGFTIRGVGDLSFQDMHSSESHLQDVFGIKHFSWCHQVHGSNLLRVEENGLQGTADALITSKKGLGLVIRTADCVPVLVFNSQEVAAIHAGWRGLQSQIIPKTVLAMQSSLETKAIIGPCICRACYEVGEETVVQMQALGIDSRVYVDRSKPKPHLDLKAIAKTQLNQAGVHTVYVMRECTLCDARFHSYRRDGQQAGRMASVIGLR